MTEDEALQAVNDLIAATYPPDDDGVIRPKKDPRDLVIALVESRQAIADFSDIEISNMQDKVVKAHVDLDHANVALANAEQAKVDRQTELDRVKAIRDLYFATLPPRPDPNLSFGAHAPTVQVTEG